jgi:hypothetical protein
MNVFHTTAALETEKPGPTDLPSQHFGAKPTDLDVWAARGRFCTQILRIVKICFAALIRNSCLKLSRCLLAQHFFDVLARAQVSQVVQVPGLVVVCCSRWVSDVADNRECVLVRFVLQNFCRMILHLYYCCYP